MKYLNCFFRYGIIIAVTSLKLTPSRCDVAEPPPPPIEKSCVRHWLWGTEFHVFTPWYTGKKNCWSFVLFIRGTVNMRDWELGVKWECLRQDFVKNLVKLVGCSLWYNVCMILATSNLGLFFRCEISDKCPNLLKKLWTFKIFSARFMNERFYKFTKSSVNSYCISQKHETSFENETLVAFNFFPWLFFSFNIKFLILSVTSIDVTDFVPKWSLLNRFLQQRW